MPIHPLGVGFARVAFTIRCKVVLSEMFALYSAGASCRNFRRRPTSSGFRIGSSFLWSSIGMILENGCRPSGPQGLPQFLTCPKDAYFHDWYGESQISGDFLIGRSSDSTQQGLSIARLQACKLLLHKNLKTPI